MRVSTALIAVAVLLAPALHAQKTPKIPPRPKLDPGIDTNNARAYYQYGTRVVGDKPEEAGHAFYWASRIDPSSGEVLYAMHVAAIIAMSSSEVEDYYDHTSKKRKPEYLALDSLLYRAYTINPFLYRSLDQPLIRHVIESEVHNEYPSLGGAELNEYVVHVLQGSRASAWQTYAVGRFPEALAAYAKKLKALDKTTTKSNKVAHEDRASWIHAERAGIFYIIGNMDSARTEMSAAMATMSEHDAKEAVFLYESKAMYDQQMGMIEERAKNKDKAREAYAHALEEDLSYYAAHSRMAAMQLEQGDTASAVGEMEFAVQLQPNDAALLYNYGLALIRARRDGEAATQLGKSVAADPYYAQPHMLLARMADVEDYKDDAVREYQTFLSLAARADPQVSLAKTRLAALTSTVAAAPAATPAAPAAAKP